jgi:hypothetical protein
MNSKGNNLYALYVSEALILLILVGVMVATGFALLRAFPFPEERKGQGPPLSSVSEQFPVKGEVVMIEGTVQDQDLGDLPGGIGDVHMIMEHLYVVQDSGDEAVHFFVVNEKTWMDEGPRVGDKVEVWASEDGEALFINKIK